MKLLEDSGKNDDFKRLKKDNTESIVDTNIGKSDSIIEHFQDKKDNIKN